MPFNLLLLPLVGGYYFLITSRFTKYIHQRIDRQKLIFNAVIAGIFLLGLAIMIIKAIKILSPTVALTLKAFIPLQLPYTGTAILSLILGGILPHISNVFVNDTKALSRSIKLKGNELEQLVRKAFLNAALVSFTMKNGKVYVGWPVSLPRPSGANYLSVLPLISGYRNDAHDIIFTTEGMCIKKDSKKAKKTFMKDFYWSYRLKKSRLPACLTLISTKGLRNDDHSHYH